MADDDHEEILLNELGAGGNHDDGEQPQQPGNGDGEQPQQPDQNLMPGINYIKSILAFLIIITVIFMVIVLGLLVAIFYMVFMQHISPTESGTTCLSEQDIISLLDLLLKIDHQLINVTDTILNMQSATHDLTNIGEAVVNFSKCNIKEHLDISQSIQTSLNELNLTVDTLLNGAKDNTMLLQDVVTILSLDNSSELLEDTITTSVQLLTHTINNLASVTHDSTELLHRDLYQALTHAVSTIMNSTNVLGVKTDAIESSIQTLTHVVNLIMENNTRLFYDQMEETHAFLQNVIIIANSLVNLTKNSTDLLEIKIDALNQSVLTLFDDIINDSRNSTEVLHKNIDTASHFAMQKFGAISNSLSVIVVAIAGIKNSTDLLEIKIDAVDHSISILFDSIINNSQNSTEILQESIDSASQSSMQKLKLITNSLSVIEDTGVAIAGIVDDTFIVAKQSLKILNGSFTFSSHVPISCQDIKNKHPNSPSGYYHINSQTVYCEMGELCGFEGGWTRLAYLDMSDSTEDCPTGFRLYTRGGVRACGRAYGGASCASVKFPSNGISYSEVCGRVVGYQYNSPDAVSYRHSSMFHHNSIDSYYVDGVSITTGFPRKHVWTLMAGFSSSGSKSQKGSCPCNDPPGTTQDVQSFVGNDYYCESGNPYSSSQRKLYISDPLWDGQQCYQIETNCCPASSGLPWFHKNFSSTTDYLELRVCGEQSTSDENVPVSFYEIYVK